MRNAFVICPVRNMTDEERNYLDLYVADLEGRGYKVHYPPRDTNQKDAIGISICMQNRRAIEEADEVHVYWNSSSEGSKFDFGIAFAMKKPIYIINRDDVKPTEGKSFDNVLLTLDWYRKNLYDNQA